MDGTSGNRASVADVAAEFTQISNFGPHNFQAGHFDSLTTLELSASDIDNVLETDILEHQSIANDFFPLWKLPTWAQVGLVDLAFQVGGPGPRGGRFAGLDKANTFPDLLAALQRRDLERAGMEADVQGDATRNAARLAFFQKELAAVPFFTTDPQKKQTFVKRLLKP